MANLQTDYYQVFEGIFKTSTLATYSTQEVTSEHEFCATILWQEVLIKYPPKRPTMHDMVYARIIADLSKDP